MRRSKWYVFFSTVEIVELLQRPGGADRTYNPYAIGPIALQGPGHHRLSRTRIAGGERPAPSQIVDRNREADGLCRGAVPLDRIARALPARTVRRRVQNGMTAEKDNEDDQLRQPRIGMYSRY